ncbi:MAG: NAD+ synthase [Candidatus Thorarchaeota archaeon]
MKIALIQMNSIVGDLNGNIEKIKNYIQQARESGAHLVVFPELVVTGYPPRDLLYEKEFIKANKSAIREISQYCQKLTVLVGFVDYDKNWRLYNCAALISNRKLVAIVRKTLLPTYDVFDEDRYFEPGRSDEIAPHQVIVEGQSITLGVEICEDLWDDGYETKVTDLLVERGAQLVINISSSPFHMGKGAQREKLVKSKATKNRVPVLLCNLVGGQDELVFDGQSIGADSSGKLIAYGEAFKEDLIFIELDVDHGLAKEIVKPSYNRQKEMFDALSLGIGDYFRKTGFERALLGLSGGIDSAVTACIAANALGPENVIGVSMPSRFSSNHSKDDAEQLAQNLGIHYVKFSIQEIVDEYHESLGAPLKELRSLFHVDMSADDSVADENIQPRVRGNALMDFSNRLKDLHILVLNTGNKTELALGYCTLYGDMTGGVGAIGDVSKLQVYELAEYINSKAAKKIIPESTIKKKPSAELKHDQFDPFDFDIVSPMVDEIIEHRLSKKELIAKGYTADIVDDVYSRIRRSEYKRWQAPPCIKISQKAFGIGWKMPIVNHYTG